jgi:hypothetical protein
MKRVVSAVLIGLGIFAIVAGFMTWSYVAPNRVTVPLNQNSTTISEAVGATYLEGTEKEVKIRTGERIVATRTVHGDPKWGTDDRVVFDVGLLLTNADTGAYFKAVRDRVALDRRSAEALNCCNENIDGESVKHKGLTYKFPFDTEKKTYDLYDLTAQKAFPMEFKGVTDVKGLEVYKFEQTIGEQVIPDPKGPREVPPALVGRTGTAALPAELVYTNTRTVWVEPVTGSIVRGQEQQKQVLRVEGADTTVFEARLSFTDKTVTEQVKGAEEKKGDITLISVVAPLALGGLGVLLLIVGLLLSRRPRHVGARRAETRERAHV